MPRNGRLPRETSLHDERRGRPLGPLGSGRTGLAAGWYVAAVATGLLRGVTAAGARSAPRFYSGWIPIASATAGALFVRRLGRPR